jgi:hypothetical protein
VGRAEVARRVEPGTAADDTRAAILECPGRAVRRRALIAGVIAILERIPNIAVHLVETPRIGLEFIDRQRPLPTFTLHAAGVGDGAVVVGLARGNRAPPPERRGCPCPRDVLPLRLAQQAVGPAGLPGKPSQWVPPGSNVPSAAGTGGLGGKVLINQGAAIAGDNALFNISGGTYSATSPLTAAQAPRAAAFPSTPVKSASAEAP